MINMRQSNIIHSPIITEKSYATKAMKNCYTFKVNFKATKAAIAKSVKELFDIDALDVKTIVVPGKKKRIGKTPNFMKTTKWKKALVTIPEGKKIDLFPEGDSK